MNRNKLMAYVAALAFGILCMPFSAVVGALLWALFWLIIGSGSTGGIAWPYVLPLAAVVGSIVGLGVFSAIFHNYLSKRGIDGSTVFRRKTVVVFTLLFLAELVLVGVLAYRALPNVQEVELQSSRPSKLSSGLVTLLADVRFAPRQHATVR